MVPLTGDIRKVRRRLSCANFEAIRPDVRLHCTALKGGGRWKCGSGKCGSR